MELLLGVDIGTTGAKALLIDARDAVLAAATEAYPFDTPRPLWAEQNPAVWWRAAARATRRVLDGRDARDVAAVGLTGQMHGLVLLDARGQVLRPCIMWNDQRSGPQCEAITRRIGLPRLLELTANPVLPGFTAPKIVWVREHEPDVYARIAHVLLPKDYVRYRLTGALATDVADASGTALFDVQRRRWSSEMLAALDIPPGWMPDCVESPAVCARISADAASETGLAAGTLVIGGAGDQAAQAVGSGVLHAGVVSVTLGTSGVVFAAAERFTPEPDGRLHAFCHAVPDRWHLMGVMLSAAGSFRWFRDALGEAERRQAADTGADVYDLLTAQAAEAPPGSEGLFFLPYLSGERTPHADPDARGAYIGLTLRHGKPHVIRALLEGVTFGLRDALELLRATGLPVREVRASGGGARSAFWRQMLADVFDAPIVTVNTTEGAAYGAALLAGAGAGLFAGVDEACAATVRALATVEPGPATRIYADAYPVYRSLYPALAAPFKAIGRLA